MSGAAGLIEPGNRHAVLRPPGRWAQRAAVRQRAVAAVERSAPHVRIGALEVGRSDDQLREDRLVGQVGRGAAQMGQVGLGDLLAEPLHASGPPPGS